MLTAGLTSAAHCEPSAKNSHAAPGPVPAPFVTPTPTPTPDPIPDPPKRVELQLKAEDSTCAVAYKVETDSAGALRVAFEDLVSDAAQGKFRAYCRLNGSVTIPKGYALSPSLALTALVQGELKGGIDNVTGRLRISLGRYAGRDFELTEYAQTDAETPVQPVKMELKTQLPETPSSCTEDLTWPVSLFVESTINGRASSRIEEIKLDSLSLVPLTCNS
jgi:hypothetical protein